MGKALHYFAMLICCYFATIGAFRAEIKGKKMRAVFVVLAFVVCAGPAWSSPGKVDSNGCHQSKKEGYHCHSGGKKGASQEELRLKRECKGRPNAGACLGYGYGGAR